MTQTLYRRSSDRTTTPPSRARRIKTTATLGVQTRPPRSRPLALELPLDHPHQPANPSETWTGLGDLAAMIAGRCARHVKPS